MDLNDVMGHALRIGVLISVSLIVTGFILLSTTPQFSELASPNSRFNTSIITPYEVLGGVAKGNGVDFILLGLMVLIATPVIRVVLGIIQFAMERNVIYVIITTIVLLNLLLSIFILPLII